MTIQEITNTQNEIIENIFANKENFLKILGYSALGWLIFYVALFFFLHLLEM